MKAKIKRPIAIFLLAVISVMATIVLAVAILQ